ncbi:MAG: hypothetical protein HC913_20510 [Microscillaceae bacterium]|nr:hypothetical protein [Microscillaceae bacterium]
MNDSLTKIFYQTLGLISLTRESLRPNQESGPDKRKDALTEGQKVYEQFIQNTAEKREELETQMSRIFQKIAENLQLGTQAEIKALQERIEALEAEVARLKAEKTKP